MKKSALIIIILFLTKVASAQDTLYFYKAGAITHKYAIAQIDSMTFTPPNGLSSGTLSDIDGNLYHWVTIGTQKFRNESPLY